MGFYFAEVRKLRRELKAAYGAGEYKKALILGKNILQKYMENDDANTMAVSYTHLPYRVSPFCTI